MAVIAAAILTKGGKILLSRHFMDVSRIRIEGLLSAFTKLLGTGSKQYTYVETGSVRYVYQPAENLYVVLVTTKNSNIVEDLQTLRLLGRILPEYVGTLDEEHVTKKAFEVLFALDEIISGGFRENVTLEQVVSLLEMNSAEEELAKEAKKKAIDDARREATRRAKEISQKKREGMLGGDGKASAGRDTASSEEPHNKDVPEIAAKKYGEADAQMEAPKPAGKGTGMSLGKSRKADHASKVLQESGVTAPVSAPTIPAPSAAAAVPSSQPITLKIEEHASVALNRDGGVTSVDVRGDLFIFVSDAQFANMRILLAPRNNDFAFKTHPNVNKQAFMNDGILATKDDKPFPVQQSLGIVRWRLQQVGKVKIPISFNCWPGDRGVSIEFELENPSLVLRDVTIVVPLGGGFPSVDDCSIGSYIHDSGNDLMQWQIPQIDQRNSSGTMQVTLDRDVPANAFFPSRVAFSCASSLAEMSIVSVTNTETGAGAPHTVETVLVADDYVVS